jgi:hypothetical protein
MVSDGMGLLLLHHTLTTTYSPPNLYLIILATLLPPAPAPATATQHGTYFAMQRAEVPQRAQRSRRCHYLQVL